MYFSKEFEEKIKRIAFIPGARCSTCIYFDGIKMCSKYEMITKPDLKCKSFNKRDKSEADRY